MATLAHSPVSSICRPLSQPKLADRAVSDGHLQTLTVYRDVSLPLSMRQAARVEQRHTCRTVSFPMPCGSAARLAHLLP